MTLFGEHLTEKAERALWYLTEELAKQKLL